VIIISEFKVDNVKERSYLEDFDVDGPQYAKIFQ
jgi:hypothetical protein